MESKLLKLNAKAAEAGAVAEFCDSVGWEGVLKPALLNAVDVRERLLVKLMMGPIEGVAATPTQIAAQCYGLGYAIALIEKVLADGAKAIDTIKREYERDQYA